MKHGRERTWESKVDEASERLPSEFYDNVSFSLVVNIISRIPEGVRVEELNGFGAAIKRLAASALVIEGDLAFVREAERPTRASRMQLGRAKKKISHSLDCLRESFDSLQKAESIINTRIKKAELRPGAFDFEPPRKTLEPARKALEDLEKQFGIWESTAAALIHPSLRKGEYEDNIAKLTPWTLNHLPFKASPKSDSVMHWVVGELYDLTEEFIGGKVRKEWVYKFIVDFLDALNCLNLQMSTSARNVATILYRRRQAKLSAQISSVSIRKED